MDIKEVKCPCCGNPLNDIWPISVKKRSAIFIGECWKGPRIKKEMPQHWFIIKIKNLEVLEMEG